MTLTLTLPKTPWVNMSPYAKFGFDRPSRSASHRPHTYKQTDRHNAFYMLDGAASNCFKLVLTDKESVCPYHQLYLSLVRLNDISYA